MRTLVAAALSFDIVDGQGMTKLATVMLGRAMARRVRLTRYVLHVSSVSGGMGSLAIEISVRETRGIRYCQGMA